MHHDQRGEGVSNIEITPNVTTATNEPEVSIHEDIGGAQSVSKEGEGSTTIVDGVEIVINEQEILDTMQHIQEETTAQMEQEPVTPTEYGSESQVPAMYDQPQDDDISTDIKRAIDILRILHDGDPETKRKRENILFVLDSGSSLVVANRAAMDLLEDVGGGQPTQIITAGGIEDMRYKGRLRLGNAVIEDVWVNPNMYHGTRPVIVLSEDRMVQENGWKFSHCRKEGKTISAGEHTKTINATRENGVYTLSRMQVCELLIDQGGEYIWTNEEEAMGPDKDAKLRKVAMDVLSHIVNRYTPSPVSQAVEKQ